MKNIILSLSVLGCLTFSGCGSSEDTETTENQDQEVTTETNEGHQKVYYCPMKCEGDKTYSEAGKCPECGMDLEVVEHDHHGEHDHQH